MGKSWTELFLKREEMAASAPPPPLLPPSEPPPGVVTSRPTLVDPASLEQLRGVLLEAAPPGYKTFLTTFDTLQGTLPTEELLYKTAVRLASAGGHSVESLLTDLNTCIEALQHERQEFSTEVQGQVDRKIGCRQEEVSRLEAEMRELGAKLAELRAKCDQEKASIEADKAKIEKVRVNFEVAFQVVLKEVLSQKDKLSTWGRSNV